MCHAMNFDDQKFIETFNDLSQELVCTSLNNIQQSWNSSQKIWPRNDLVCTSFCFHLPEIVNISPWLSLAILPIICIQGPAWITIVQPQHGQLRATCHYLGQDVLRSGEFVGSLVYSFVPWFVCDTHFNFSKCKSPMFMTYRVGQKTGPFLRVDNFTTVGGRNACDMSKISKFYLEKNLQLAYQCVKYSLPNLHKYSMSLKLRWIWQ